MTDIRRNWQPAQYMTRRTRASNSRGSDLLIRSIASPGSINIASSKGTPRFIPVVKS
jgi:hypothetical protein